MNGFDLEDYDLQDDDLELVKQRILQKKMIEGLQNSQSDMVDPVLSNLAGGIDVLARHSAAQLDPVATITGLPVKGYQTPNAASEYQKALASRLAKTKTKALDETQMLKNLEDIKTNRLKAQAEAQYKRQKGMTDLYKAQQWAEIQKQNAKTAADRAFWDAEGKKIQNAINQQRADTERMLAVQAKIPLAQAQTGLTEERAISEEQFREPKIGKIGAETGLIGERAETEDVLRDPRADLLRAQAEKARAGAQKDKAGAGKPKDITKGESALRKEYQGNPATKRTQILSESFAKIANGVNSPSAAGDVSLIFNFMRMNDPESTVREGEFATAQNAAGVPDRIKGLYNRIISGERLTPQQRADFYGTAENLFNAQVAQQAAIDNQYGVLADQYGYKRENILRPWIKQQMKKAPEKPKPTKEEALMELRRRGRIK